MEIHFIPSLVLLSVTIAIFASYVALNLAHSVTQAKGKSQIAWLAGGALAMGFGIWSMHFVGMLAFEMPGMQMAYDIPLMVLSVLVAIGGSALSLYVVSRPVVATRAVVFGGFVMAAAISGMHYIGMHSMRMSARILWDEWLVLLSVVIALIASYAALMISIRQRSRMDRFLPMALAGIIMGIAIAGMHYTGMLAATFEHDPSIHIADSNLLVSSQLTTAVIAMTVVILALALAGSFGHRLFNLLSQKAQEGLITSEERFRLLIDAVKDYAIFMLDPNGVITTWNSGAERITGYSEREIVGQHVSVLSGPEQRPTQESRMELEKALRDGSFEGEGVRIRKDGRPFIANIVITPLYNSQGEHTGFSKVTRDVTELKAAENKLKTLNEELEKRVFERTVALQKSEAQLRMIANAIPVLVGQVDSKERLLFANDAFTSWFQHSSSVTMGQSLREVLGPRYTENEDQFRKALAGEVVTYEKQTQGADREAVFHITLVPEVDSRGVTKSVIVVASDVSKYKEIEAQLKTAKEAADTANATKSSFLANMSHEIRTPLGAVLGFSELIINDDLSPEDKANSIEIIKRNGKLLSNIINDILDLSKVEAGKLDIEKIDVPFMDLITEVHALQNLEATGKGVILTFRSVGAIPTTLKTDPTRLRQILFNVIGNAVKFTERGSVTVKISLVSTEGPTRLAFKVIDTGAGISQEQAAKLFSPFTQADVSTTRKFGGTGLGLVLSKKLAQSLGGDLILEESSPGKGSTFVVTIDPGPLHELVFANQELGERAIPVGSR